MSRLTPRLGAAALSALTLAVPVASASAMTMDSQPHQRGPGHAIVAISSDLRSPDAREAAAPVAAAAADLRSPDARAAGVPAPATSADLRSPDARDLRRGPVETPPVTRVVEVPDGGLDWGDAGLGAAMAALLAGTLALASQQRRRHAAVPAH